MDDDINIRNSMISIIVCGRTKNPSVAFCDNIKDTIGDIQYEIVWINNTSNRYSIFEAYNLGVSLSKYSFLCFCHDDIIFRTSNWGKIVESYFKTTDSGAIGVMGSHYLDHNSIYYHIPNICRGHVLQGFLENGTYKTRDDSRYRYKDLGSSVVAIDGLWIVIKKDLFTRNVIRWDDINYHGFHMYDMDICMQIKTNGYKIQIADDILIEHQSEGNPSRDFYVASKVFHKKWYDRLPIMEPIIPKSILIESLMSQIDRVSYDKTILEEYKMLNNDIFHKIATKLTLLFSH